ncbi:hypothetical protein FXO38_17960 [Capsicum annuum]|uniref:Uncharacterized protein n=1 Tax=Capsicum annuum TaxID=4072 RepID=A0A2G2Y3I9_CAPAN|nr:hypothetical protein FXO38_17960 [Capsicum annuum]PHT64336.1 hypothetical protein T459_31687 [Capsicum annuum]
MEMDKGKNVTGTQSFGHERYHFSYFAVCANFIGCKVIDRIKKELFGATTITRRKIILESALIVIDDGSGSGAAVGANNAPLTVFKTTNHYDYDHTGYTDFATSSKCLTCKCQDCKMKHDGVINVINALTASAKKITSKRGFIPSKRISYPYTLLEIKLAKRRRKENFQGIIKHRDCSLFVAAYAEYLSDGFQVPNDGIDAGLLRKRYDDLLWKYGEAKAQKPYASDIKDPRQPQLNSITPDEKQLVHIE